MLYSRWWRDRVAFIIGKFVGLIHLSPTGDPNYCSILSSPLPPISTSDAPVTFVTPLLLDGPY